MLIFQKRYEIASSRAAHVQHHVVASQCRLEQINHSGFRHQSRRLDRDLALDAGINVQTNVLIGVESRRRSAR
jgi:hypothetical protein